MDTIQNTDRNPVGNRSRFAPVASLGHMRKLRDCGALGDYHLLLAHKVLENVDAWQDMFCLYNSRNQNQGHPTIIMDNSLIELGEPMRMEEVLKAAHAVGARYVVLEDHLGKMESTIGSTRRSMRDFRRLYKPDYGREIKTVAVVQGQTLDEIRKCAEVFVRELQVDMISVPRILTKTLGSRVQIAAELGQTYNKPIHLLGFSDDMMDDIATCVVVPEVVGIDSAVPIRIGLNGSCISRERNHPPRPADYLDMPYESLNVQAIQNVQRFRNWINR